MMMMHLILSLRLLTVIFVKEAGSKQTVCMICLCLYYVSSEGNTYRHLLEPYIMNLCHSPSENSSHPIHSCHHLYLWNLLLVFIGKVFVSNMYLVSHGIFNEAQTQKQKQRNEVLYLSVPNNL